MAGMGHEERLPPPRLSARCGFRKETITGMRAATGETGRSVPTRHTFCVLTTRKHLETLGIAGQPHPLVESHPGAPRHWARRVEPTLVGEHRCKRIMSSSAPGRPDASWPTVLPRTPRRA